MFAWATSTTAQLHHAHKRHKRELGISPPALLAQGRLQGQKRIRDMQAFDTVQFKTMGLKRTLDRVTQLMTCRSEPYYYEAAWAT